MLLRKVLQLVITAAVFWHSETNAATSAAVKLCGRQLSEIMSRVCHAYNNPTWDDVPTVVEQPGSVARRKRQLGIVEECCVIGCTWEQLSEYCSVSSNAESPFEDMDSHSIADRSAEAEASKSGQKATVAESGVQTGASSDAAGTVERRREVGRARSRGYGRRRARPRCRCMRKRRTGRRRRPNTIMGNTELVKNVRAAPVVGTVSPLITWGRTLNTDLPASGPDRDRYAYVVYT